MGERQLLRCQHIGKSFKLCRYKGFNFFRRGRTVPASEVLCIRESWMGTDGYVVPLGQRCTSAHEIRISCMNAAGDVSGCNQWHEFGFMSHPLRGVVLAHIAVQINGCHVSVSRLS